MSVTDFRIQIAPLELPVSHRPVWSVMIPAYNCAGYLSKTLQGVLAQDMGSAVMQIEVVDDYSTKDDPEAVVREIGNGRVDFFRQPENRGHSGNFETCLKRAKGEYVHLLHGDDIVKPGYYERVQKVFESDPSIGAVFCRHNHISEKDEFLCVSPDYQSEDGVLDNWLEKMTTRQIIQTPSIAVRREVYERLGAFDKRLSWCEDWEMWCRIGSKYKIGYVHDVFAEYRIHTSSNSGRYIVTGENLRDLQRGIRIISEYVDYLPKSQYLSQTLDVYAHYGLDTALKVLEIKEGAINQLKESLKMVGMEHTYFKAALVFDNIRIRHCLGFFHLFFQILTKTSFSFFFLKIVLKQEFKRLFK